MSSATAERPKAAQRIQSAAKDLFYRQGIRATGVEEVCRVAEATKMSLYRAYPSKDALVAAILADDDDATRRSAAIAGAWSKVVKAARFVGESAVQLHGGMGVTDELTVGAYLKRVVALEAIAGPAQFHLKRYAALSGRITRAA